MSLPDPAEPTPPAFPTPPRRRWWQLLAPALVGAAVGGALAAAGMPVLSAVLDPLVEAYGAGAVPVFLLAVFVAAWLGVAIHELGHLLGGLETGFRFRVFLAGALKVERKEGGLRWALVRPPFSGGMVVMIPRGTHALVRRLAVFLAAGPAGSLLGVGIGAAALATLPADAAVARLVAAAFAALCVVLLLLSGIPLHRSGLETDGEQLRVLARGGPAARRKAAMYLLMGRLHDGVPPRDWPAEQVDAVREPRDGTVAELGGAALVYSHAMDRGDVAAAGVEVDRMVGLVGGLPPGLVGGIHVEAAYFAALHRNDAARARQHLAAVPARAFGVEPHERLRAEAALALAVGDRAAARATATAAEATVPAHDALSRTLLADLLRRTEVG